MPAERLAVGVRHLLLGGSLIGAVGLAGRFLPWPLLTATLGPTAYVFVAHPSAEISRWRNAVLGHAVAVGAGLAALAAWGLWHHPPISQVGHASLPQVGAAATATGITLLILGLIDSHHAPAAATALLVATGLARPGRPLVGLVIGLAVVLVLAPLVAKVPFARGLDHGSDPAVSADSGAPRHRRAAPSPPAG